MGFLSNLASATIKMALTPVAIVKDVVNVATDTEPNSTKKLLNSAQEDASAAIDNLGDANI